MRQREEKFRYTVIRRHPCNLCCLGCCFFCFGIWVRVVCVLGIISMCLTKTIVCHHVYLKFFVFVLILNMIRMCCFSVICKFGRDEKVFNVDRITGIVIH